MAKIKNWLKRNKEGAIVGGIIGAIIGYFAIQGGESTSGFILSILMLPLGLIGINIGELAVSISFIFSVVIFLIIGAFIDSIWRPHR